MNKLVMNPNNKKYYSEEYIKGWENGVKAQYEARPKGEWIESDIGWKCSECNYGVKPWNNTDFCPNCGADMRGAEMISPKEFAEKMGQIAEEKDDTEVCHVKMDDYICEVLRTLGYEEGVKIFEDTPKWYS